jgi:hypothetical protein
MGIGRAVILVGLAVVIVGAVMTWAPWMLRWFGKLPGDLHIETPSGTVHIPLASMFILSLALTLIVNLFFRR